MATLYDGITICRQIVASLPMGLIAPLAALDSVGHQMADEAAQQLGLSRRQVYLLIQRFRQGTGSMTDLVPRQSSGGKGKGRLPESVERIIQELLRKQYLNRQKRTLSKLCRDIKIACKDQGLPVPARNTVSLRIARLNPIELKRRREGADAVRSLQSAGGPVPEVQGLLAQVQIDHTPIDLMIVDERDRQPIGRPYLTIAIDVYSRCIVGMVVTLEPPSTVSVGLCLGHIACDKRPWLERLELEVDWPMSGKPLELYLDNAAEFKSEALRRGCELHGIALKYRPPGQPHYGGIVERLIGTMMVEVHDLPGTTFSNPGKRGDYDSEKRAALTLRELERWLTLAIAYYHKDIHGNNQTETPSILWAEGINRFGLPAVVTHATAFLIDFLPVIRRTLTRTGFVIDHIGYFADSLKPLIARRDKRSRFLIRRDPRDLSRIWVLEPDTQHYLEIPYRTLSNPAITLWEHRQVLARLRQLSRDRVDESALFRVVKQMRAISSDAQKATKKTRRNNERLQHLKNSAPKINQTPRDNALEPNPIESNPALPYAEIEEW